MPPGRARASVHCILVTAAVFVCDRITKHLVVKHIPLGESVPDAGAFVRLWHTQNDGVAFSLFQGHRAPLMAIQSVIVVAIAVLMIVCFRRLRSARHPLMAMTAFSLMLGGGLGNLYDRLDTGLVTDFVSIGRFAVFNAADACLTAGCGLLLLYVLLYTGRTD
jgi:signal peptidase II